MMVETRSQNRVAAEQARAWDKLELLFESDEGQSRYLSRIIDISSQHLTIERPTLISGESLFKPDAPFTATFFRADAAYWFRSKVIEAVGDPVKAFRIDAPSQVERNQRRRYFRIEADFPATLSPADEPLSGEADVDGLPRFSGQCLNISANGLLVRTPMENRVGGKLLISIDIPRFESSLNTVGIVRLLQPSHQEKHYEYGIEFFTDREVSTILDDEGRRHLPETFRGFNQQKKTALHNFVFAQQLSLRKKRLL